MNTISYQDWRPPCWLSVIVTVGNCRPPVHIRHKILNILTNLCQKFSSILKYWSRDELADNFQATISNGFSWVDVYEFWLIQLKFVPRYLINHIPALLQIRFGANQAVGRHLKQWWLVYWRIYVSHGLNEVIEVTALVIISSDMKEYVYSFFMT